MGSRGPLPNRTDDLAYPREKQGGRVTPVTKGRLLAVEGFEPDDEWHKIARMIWDAAGASGMSDFYQQSDWAILYTLCDDITFYKNRGVRSGQMLATIMSALSSLGLTEGDRRRMHIELTEESDGEEDATVVVMDKYRQGLQVAQ